MDQTQATILTEAAALEAIRSEWREVAESLGNPFVTPEWFFAWLGACGGEETPYVPVVRRADGSLAGLLPLVVSTRSRRPALRFAGAGLGDYFQPVAAAAEESSVAAAAAAALSRRRCEWVTVLIDNVDEAAQWLQDFLGSPVARLAAIRRYGEVTLPYADLAGHTWESYLGTRSSNFRGQIRRKFRALERAHDVTFRRTETSADLAIDMASLFDLHLRRHDPRDSAFADARVRAFHEAFAAAALRRGWLRLWHLELDGNPVAAWYGWHIGGRYLYYQAGFDPSWSTHSPGLLMLAHTVRSAIEEGALEYDMLLGAEPFKARFATGERTVHGVVATRARHPARVVAVTNVWLRKVARRLRIRRLLPSARRA